jgi:Zn-dependent M28 family amino/carboxypeptidase
MTTRIATLLLIAPLVAAAADQPPADFSGARAFAHLEAICKLGPRPSGSEAMRQQRAMLARYFREAGGKVIGQAFQIRDRHTGKPVHIENVIISWHPDRTERILIAAHYDTRPFPDRDPVNPRGVFIGANDGASGVALLMELAQFMPALPGPLGVDFVLFDAEEYVFSDRDKYCIGSEYFAREYRAKRRTGGEPNYRAAIVVDMIAGKHLEIWQEVKNVSWPESRPLVDSVWAVAGKLGAKEFIPRPKYDVIDDHVPLRNIAGIPSCEIIDFGFTQREWHTTRDLPEACSAESLATVGRVLLAWLREQR